MFNRQDHIAPISNADILKIVEPAFEFFKALPALRLGDLPKFEGAGVYTLYLDDIEGTEYEGVLPVGHPIYVGKAVPSGSRQVRKRGVGPKLRDRLCKHARSIKQVDNLSIDQFRCRFMIMEGEATDMISAMESYLIRAFNPLWNSYIDGFGINAPGAGRYNQAPSEWDTLHPGRYYATQLTGTPRDISQVRKKMKGYNPKGK